ncbi:MAG: immunoglobulin domain-containing protein, partial [Verrucomicrobia bacterium]|nr:immunoglobulin domain-containing protein [Verrucomicrobiota bacterium]
GPLSLRWTFSSTPIAPPTILGVPTDQAVNLGDPLTLSVSLTNTAGVQFKWFLGIDEVGVTTPSLVIPSVQATNVGLYRLRIDIGSVRYFTQPVEIQINTDGATNALARDKILDAVGTPLTPSLAGGGGFAAKGVSSAGGVLRGYNGSQIFNTTFSTADPNEPPTCGFTNGSSYWFSYQAPTNGTITVDTIGSTFDTVIEAYAYTVPLTNYADLVPITCDNDSVATNGAGRITFAVALNRQYVVVVTGVNGARGIAQLNYLLNASIPPVPPTLTQAPTGKGAGVGSTVDLAASVIGSPPLHYRWSKAGSPLAGATNSFLHLTNLVVPDSGDYVLSVSNHIGGPLLVTLPLRVFVLPSMQVAPMATADGAIISFTTISGQQYVVEHTEVLSGPWAPMSNLYSGDNLSVVLTNFFNAPSGFFRVRVQ